MQKKWACNRTDSVLNIYVLELDDFEVKLLKVKDFMVLKKNLKQQFKNDANDSIEASKRAKELIRKINGGRAR